MLVPNKYLVYTTVIEGMLKVRKNIQSSIDFTIPNEAVEQVAIKAKKRTNIRERLE